MGKNCIENGMGQPGGYSKDLSRCRRHHYRESNIHGNISVSTGSATPEPATFLLLTPALGVLALFRRKAKKL